MVSFTINEVINIGQPLSICNYSPGPAELHRSLPLITSDEQGRSWLLPMDSLVNGNNTSLVQSLKIQPPILYSASFSRAKTIAE